MNDKEVGMVEVSERARALLVRVFTANEGASGTVIRTNVDERDRNVFRVAHKLPNGAWDIETILLDDALREEIALVMLETGNARFIEIGRELLGVQ